MLNQLLNNLMCIIRLNNKVNLICYNNMNKMDNIIARVH